ncbi:MAG: hypothetical protein A2176_06280 [Spirochaetes bacterium RBG_13_51_14]|nr:MAG: hypothetical protein A2176_06280 [Spirochaetes bacterium RBG_13_51_14]
MARLDPSVVEGILSRVQKPGRYLGRELNVIVKEEARLRMALCYPDLYDVGMSNNGLRILYDIANAMPGVACERVFAAAADLEAILRESGVTLYTLETYTPLSDLDLIGFNVSHELLCTNILQILDLGGIPLRRGDRGEGAPIVIAGGEAVSNPFPLGDFIDAFYIGDGEEGIREIVQAVLDAKEKGLGRCETLERIGAVDGVLLPSRYAMTYEGCAIAESSGAPVRKRVYRGRDLADPAKPLVPNIRIAQERVVIEVTRGCGNFCNFCHAGYYDLPYRCYDHSAAAQRIMVMVRNTGYNEVTLSSLSISDYPSLVSLINAVLPGLTERGISISFPSLRVDAATLPLIEQISEVRRASLTFAVESASEEIRALANKRIRVRDLTDIMRRVRDLGWKVIKLYFMIGLPGCEEHDEAADIINLLKEIHRVARAGMEINVTVSPFVPKPHTPFQRERQMGRDYFENAIRRIKRGLPRSVKIKNHDVEASILEGVIARGDTRLGEVICRSYREGCRFDSWEEHFRFDIWRKNLDEVIPGWERCLDRRSESVFPWNFVATGFERLTIERMKADTVAAEPRQGTPTTRGEIAAAPIEEAKKRFERRFAVTGCARIRLAKIGMMRFIPHIDLMEIVKRALRMADIPVSMSQGFNKRERISAGYPLPLGIESEAELFDIHLFDEIDDGCGNRINAFLPLGIIAADIYRIEERVSLMAITAVIEYRVVASSRELYRSITENLASGIGFTKLTKQSARMIPFEQVVYSYGIIDDNSLLIRLYAGSEQSVRADDAVAMLAGIEGRRIQGIRIVKTAQYRINEDGLTLII